MTKKMIPTDTIPLNISDIWDCTTVRSLQTTLQSLHDHLNSYSPEDEVFSSGEYYESDLCIQKYREETDKEYKYRLDKEEANAQRTAEGLAKIRAKKEEKERKQFEKLKKKFGTAG